MKSKSAPLNDIPDILAELTYALEHGGAWCHKYGDKNPIDHYWIARNTKSQLAISLCQIVTMKKSLFLTTSVQKCMPCAIFEQSRKEAQQRLMQM